MFYIKFDRLKPSKYETAQYVRYLMWMMEELQRKNTNPYLAEQLVIIDFEGVGFSNVSVDLIKSVAAVLQACYSGLLHKQLLINTSFLVSTTWNVVKLFVREEVRDRTFFYSDDFKPELKKMIEKSQIPKNYGGKGPKI